MSSLLTKDVAMKAVVIIAPLVSRMSAAHITARPHLHVVVFDSGGETLYEESFGNKIDWMYPYDVFARSKAEISFRTKLNSRYVQQCQPHLLLPGDVKYGGGVYFEGIVVGVSGVEEHYDEFFATCIAAGCRALCIAEMQVLPSARNYMP